jgi:hypothetical protein
MEERLSRKEVRLMKTDSEKKSTEEDEERKLSHFEGRSSSPSFSYLSLSFYLALSSLSSSSQMKSLKRRITK